MPLKAQPDETPNVNLTSLIDVVFLLIVFFMTAAKFTDTQRDIDLNLPEVADSAALSVAPRNRQVAVHADGRIELDGAAVTIDELTQELSATIGASRPTVVVLGDAGCPFQHIAATMAACKDAGVTELSVSVQVASSSGAARR